MDNPNVKVRFAPSPTGVPHVGNIRTALFDYFEARHNNGIFVLRIEDTDQARKVEGAIDAIKESLLWLGAEWDEEATQSERLDEYKKYTDILVENGKARVEENGAVRFIIPKETNDEVKWVDAVGKREISFKTQDLEDFIILKADGYPTYHMANVVDDHLMGITHVIRAQEWVPSTPKHILIYKALSWDPPIFAHVPNVNGVDGKKLSKRFGAKSALDYRSEGYLAEALLNYLMLLGWSPKNDEQTIISKEQIIQEFSLDRVNASPAIFNENKLLWLNGEYIRMMDVDRLAKRLLDFDNSLKESLSEVEFRGFVACAQTRIKTLFEFKEMVDPFIAPAGTPDSVIKTKLREKLMEIEEWNNDQIFAAIKSVTESHNVKLPEIYEAIINVRRGLPLSEVFEVIGRERTLSLLK